MQVNRRAAAFAAVGIVAVSGAGLMVWSPDEAGFIARLRGSLTAASNAAVAADQSRDIVGDSSGNAATGTGASGSVSAVDPMAGLEPPARAVLAFATLLERIDAFAASADTLANDARIAHGEALLDEVALHEREERLLPGEALSLRLGVMAKTIADQSLLQVRANDLVAAHKTRIQALRKSAEAEQTEQLNAYRTRMARSHSEADAMRLAPGSPERDSFVEARRIDAAREIFNPARTRVPADR